MLAACGVLQGTSTPAQSDAVIWESDDQSVVLGSQDDGAPPNDHPVTLAPGDIEKMLSGLRLTHTDEDAQAVALAVFTPEQIGILGAAMAEGLARARPSQDVMFSMVGAHRLSPGAFARRNRLTAGRVFFRDGHLNVIFGELQSPYRKKNVYGKVDEDFYPRNFGSRAAAEDLDTKLIASPAAALHRGPDGERNDWVVLDPALAHAEVTPAPAPVEPPARPEPIAEPAPRAEPTPRAEPEPPADVAPPTPVPVRPVPAQAPTPEPEAASEIEQRLETLKRLRDKGLISDDAYRKKMEEILGDL
jgi:hypothetical protein